MNVYAGSPEIPNVANLEALGDMKERRRILTQLVAAGNLQRWAQAKINPFLDLPVNIKRDEASIARDIRKLPDDGVNALLTQYLGVTGHSGPQYVW